MSLALSSCSVIMTSNSSGMWLRAIFVFLTFLELNGVSFKGDEVELYKDL